MPKCVIVKITLEKGMTHGEIEDIAVTYRKRSIVFQQAATFKVLDEFEVS